MTRANQKHEWLPIKMEESHTDVIKDLSSEYGEMRVKYITSAVYQCGSCGRVVLGAPPPSTADCAGLNRIYWSIAEALRANEESERQKLRALFQRDFEGFLADLIYKIAFAIYAPSALSYECGVHTILESKELLKSIYATHPEFEACVDRIKSQLDKYFKIAVRETRKQAYEAKDL